MALNLLMDGLTLPECLRWHDNRAWFSDLFHRRVCSMAADGSDLRVEGQFDSVPAGLGWLPSGELLVALQHSHLLLRREQDGTYAIHADLTSTSIGAINDMVVDAVGTAYVGCHGFDIYQDEPLVATGPIIKVTLEGDISVVGEPAHFSNGSTINNNTFIVAESLGNRISQYDILGNGSLRNRRDWARFGTEPTAKFLNARLKELSVAADGISGVDQEGAIWVADFLGNRALRVLPGGQISDSISTGELSCYCVALGGEDGRTLFLCAAPTDIAPETHQNNPRGIIASRRVDVPLASLPHNKEVLA